MSGGADSVTSAPAPLWATVLGVGLWTPEFPDAAAWSRGQRVADPAAAVPPPRLPPRLRRRTSLLIRMVAEVAAQALEQAGVSPDSIPMVVGSAFGELGTTVEMLDELEAEGGLLSPTRFHNSVHNSAAGYLSIAHGNRTSSTSLAAGNETVAMVLLEALTILGDRGGDVLVIVADEALPLSLVSDAGSGAVSAALVLRAGRVSSPASPAVRPLAFVGDLRQITSAAPAAERAVEVASPSAATLPLIAAIRAARSSSRPIRIDLAPDGTPPRWSIVVEVPGQEAEST